MRQIAKISTLLFFVVTSIFFAPFWKMPLVQETLQTHIIRCVDSLGGATLDVGMFCTFSYLSIWYLVFIGSLLGVLGASEWLFPGFTREALTGIWTGRVMFESARKSDPGIFHRSMFE